MMAHSRLLKFLLAVCGIALGLMIDLAALQQLRPPPATPATTTAGCVEAPGEWLSFVYGVVGAYREVCGEFPSQPQEEGFPTVIRYNNYGLVDTDYTLEKPPGVFRIVIVGDSFAQGVQVNREQGFPWLLEQQLKEVSAQKVEVINLSVDAYGTDRELLLYAVLGWQFQPDLVLLSVYTGNDIQDNNIDLEHRRYSYRLNRPYFTLKNGSLRLHNSPFYDYHAYPDSPVFYWLATMQAMQLPVTPENPPPRPRVLQQYPYIIEYPVEAGLYLPEDTYWSDAWAVTEALIKEFREVVETVEGARFGVVIIPDRRAIHTEDWALTLNTYGKLLPALYEANIFEPNKRLETFLTSNQIPVLDLTWALLTEAQSTGERLYYYDDGHFNAHGHLVAARRIALWLQGQDLVPLKP